MYRGVLLGALSSAALLSPAFAADIYSPAPPPAYAAVVLPPSWTGFYIGVNGGFGGESGLPFREDVFFPGGPFGGLSGNAVAGNPFSVIRGADTIAGGFGGGQAGYNFQFGAFVFGVEGDIQGSGIRGSGANAIINPYNVNVATAVGPAGICQNTTAYAGGGLPGGACTGRNSLDVDWFGTIRGRVGYAFGNTLVYGTGGFAAGGVQMTSLYTDNNVLGLGSPAPGIYPATQTINYGQPQFARVSRSETSTGWTAGAGIEVKLSPSWSLKGEYQFINLGTISAGPGEVTIPTATGIGTTVNPCASTTASVRSQCLHLTSSKEVQFNTVRVGINYLFNAAPEPLPLK